MPNMFDMAVKPRFVLILLDTRRLVLSAEVLRLSATVYSRASQQRHSLSDLR